MGLVHAIKIAMAFWMMILLAIGADLLFFRP
jgi:hypothetical protein